MQKKAAKWDARVAYAVIIAGVVALFVWVAHDNLAPASVFFLLAAAYAALLFGVVWRSVRASTVMQFAIGMISFSLISIEGDLGALAACSWFLGILAGGIAGGHPWSGKRPGSDGGQKRERNGEGYTGGLRLAVINAASAVVLVGLGVTHLVLQTPTAVVGAVLIGALVAGWALFRFPPSLQTRNVLLLVIPVEFFLLLIVGGNTGQRALPFVWAYGILAGILLGGRYWSGPRLGEPRPPYNVQAKRQRKRKRKSRAKAKQKPNTYRPTDASSSSRGPTEATEDSRASLPGHQILLPMS
ncbi:hypothetical protein J2Y66_004301 [Paenarthrobacter nitroguajacolicus]|uniref:hypothetical protein n=1 Tax=Paenarthrobacter nitroguajacolicus TaxID=211146 RepID=UPI00285FE9E9|nr:hypothetical protein [Paenarthrobacter nitroguajacolicus]MDR6989784.1 hypothetical protein [Paenarthrobacter nitroguajacolicus]